MTAPRLLFLQYEQPLGAAIMATPLFEAVRTALPQAKIVVACGATASMVLAKNPNLDAVIRTPDPVANLPRALWAFFRRVSLVAGAFDYVITDASNARTRIALLSLLVPTRKRLGFSLARWLYRAPFRYDPASGVLANNMRIAAALGYSGPTPEPKLYFSEEDATFAAEFARKHALDGAAPIICLATQFSGGYPEKRGWEAARFAETADRLAHDHGARIVFVGTTAEAKAIEGIREQMRARAVTAAGAFSAPQFAAFLARSDLLVTLDTGSLHVARAVGLPAVVIARPWQPAQEWLPVGIAGYAILAKPEIVSRFRSDPTFEPPSTIDEISIDEVVLAANALLQDSPPSPDARAERSRARLR